MCAHSAHALATVISKSGPSFSKEGIYASQEWLAARLAKQLVRNKVDVRLVRRATNLLVKVGALRVDPQSGSTNLLVPLLAGDRLYDAVETKREGGTTASATPDASVRSTPDATVLEPRTPASYKSSYKNIHRRENINKLPPYPPVGGGAGDVPITLNLNDDPGHQQQASSSEEGGYPNGSETDRSDPISSPKLANGPILTGEVLPPEDEPTFKQFWKACAEPRGSLGFALSEWAKLSSDEQWRACQRPSRNDTYAGTWLRQRAFDLPPSVIEDRPRYSLAAIAAMSDEEWDDYTS